MINQIWDTISNFGTSKEHINENLLIRLFNQMSLLSLIGTLPVLIGASILGLEVIYVRIISVICVMYIMTILSNYYGRITLARLIVAVGTPLGVSISNILVGGFFSQSLALAASMVITYVVFQKDIIFRNVLLILQVCIYFSSLLFLFLFEPIYIVSDYLIDEIAVFLGGIGWIIIVLISYDRKRDNLIQDLKEKNIQLKETTEELERFSYIASHDLKSPLRTITSFIGLIERDVKKQNFDGINEKLHFVKSGAEQMNFLVQDILELSKLKNTENSERVLVDLNVILEKAKTNLTKEIKDRDVTIYAEYLPSFYCNEVEILLLFQNFIQNGIKYNVSKKPIIAISTFETNSTLSLSFRDNGIGIAEEYHEQIFQFFKRLHNSDEYQGTGLGLGLCMKIIKSHGGEVDVDSVEGAGSTFTIKFPLEENQNTVEGKKTQTISV